MRDQKSWTAKELSAASDMWLDGLSATKISARVGRSKGSVIGALDRAGIKRLDSKANGEDMNKPIKPPGNWTDGEDAYVKRSFRKGVSFEKMASELNRRIDSVRIRSAILQRLG